MEEEWEVGWVVRNERSGAEHRVLGVHPHYYLLIPVVNENNPNSRWSLIKNRTVLNTYVVVSRESQQTETFLRYHPPVPARNEIVDGPLWRDSIYRLRPSSQVEGYPVEIYVPETGFVLPLDLETLENFRRAFNTLAPLLRENRNELEVILD